MPWFKVDDGFWSHPKTLQLSDGAQALWMRAGSWSMHQLTDGFIPDFALPILSAKPRYVNELRSVSLWLPGKEGNQFHDWDKYQPTREQVEADRLAAADRKRKSREKSQGPSRVTNSGVTPDDTPTPTRPDPTRPDPLNKEPKNLVQPAVELQAKFDEWWKLYPRKTGKLDALKAFKATLKVTDIPTLMEGTRAYVLLNIGQDKSLIKMPAGWLRSGRWADEDQVAYTPPDTPFAPQPRTVRLATELTECDKHRGYPLPCAACLRDPLTPEGAEF